MTQRVVAFSEAQHLLSDPVDWRVLGHIWCGAYDQIALWKSLLSSKRAERERFTWCPKDRAHWQSLPEVITIYRGRGEQHPQGVYFSLDRTVAEVAINLDSRTYGDTAGTQGRVFFHGALFAGSDLHSQCCLIAVRCATRLAYSA
jgi:hypothetical protein